MKIINILIAMLLMMASGLTLSEELKDPMTRNEDISHTIVTANVTIGEDGNYIYEYAVNSPSTNLGEISALWIDISCNLDLSSSLGLPSIDDYSKDVGDGKHIPVYAEADYGKATTPVITVDNMVSFGIFLTPGTSTDGIRIISAQPPTERKYELHPVMETTGWDYSAFPEDPELDENGKLPYPWIEDFTVVGTIQAPACSIDGQEPPPDDGGDGGDGGTDCNKGKGNAYGLESGKGHEISKGKHLGHDHNCE